MDSESDDDFPSPSHVVTLASMLAFGLNLLGYTLARVERAMLPTNKERFLKSYGVEAETACIIYEDMQITDVAEAKIEGNELSLKHFLMGLYYLRKYPKEIEIEQKFDYSMYHGREVCWNTVTKTQALKNAKILWPDDLDHYDAWMLSVDGVHSWTVEYEHAEFSQWGGQFLGWLDFNEGNRW